MLDLSMIDRDLTEPSASDLETTDERLAKIMSLTASDHFSEAAEAAQSLFEGGTYDLRILGPFLFGVYLERGMETVSYTHLDVYKRQGSATADEQLVPADTVACRSAPACARQASAPPNAHESFPDRRPGCESTACTYRLASSEPQTVHQRFHCYR